MGLEIKNNNTDKIKNSLSARIERGFTIIGMNMEKYAKALCPVGTVQSTGKKGYRGGTLRNSITNVVEGNTLTVGSNVEYAPYVELGTGPNFTPPPEWEEFTTEHGKGLGHGYVTPRPFLRPAIVDHAEEYKKIMVSEIMNL